MRWQIDSAAPGALHEQIAANIRRGVADGELAGGEALPPAKELAGMLAVNPNTVLAAYRSLRSEGLLEFRRGRSVRVLADVSGLASVTDAARALLALGRSHGYGAPELAGLLAQLGPEQAR
jgi:DNA-binding transcriptional regulator YhcF (GntR family)